MCSDIGLRESPTKIEFDMDCNSPPPECILYFGSILDGATRINTEYSLDFREASSTPCPSAVFMSAHLSSQRDVRTLNPHNQGSGAWEPLIYSPPCRVWHIYIPKRTNNDWDKISRFKFGQPTSVSATQTCLLAGTSRGS